MVPLTPRLTWVLAALTALFIAIKPVTAAPPLVCEAFVAPNMVHERSNMFRVDGLSDPDGAAVEGGALCGGTFEGWNWQVRGAVTYEDGDWDPDPTIRRLSHAFEIDDQWTFTIGKEPRGWDGAYVAQPLDFLGDVKDYVDIKDRLGELEPSILAAVDYFGEDWTLSAVVGENRTYDQKRVQMILTAERNLGGTNVQALLQKTPEQPLGLGGGLSSVIGQSLELHFSVFARQGTARPIHRSLVDGDFRFFPSANNPIGAHRINDDKWYPRWVTGGQWTAVSGLNFLAEWMHDQRGLNSTQWNRLKRLTDFHASGNAFGVSGEAIDGNLRYDAASIRVGGNMRDYLFLRASYPVEQWEFEANALTNLHDASVSSGLRVTREIRDDLIAWLELRANLGRDGTEFGEVPTGHSVFLAIKKFF